MTCILAIDPGITGALAFYYPKQRGRISIYDMPIVNGDVDPHQVHQLIKNHQPNQAIIERVSPMPKEGVSSVWRFASAFTTVCVVVKLMKIPLTLVPASKWKRFMLLQGGKEGKTQALGRAIEEFPETAHFFVLKKHHGRAEAALLAIYADYKLRKEISDVDQLPTPLAEQP